MSCPAQLQERHLGLTWSLRVALSSLGCLVCAWHCACQLHCIPAAWPCRYAVKFELNTVKVLPKMLHAQNIVTWMPGVIYLLAAQALPDGALMRCPSSSAHAGIAHLGWGRRGNPCLGSQGRRGWAASTSSKQHCAKPSSGAQWLQLFDMP